MELRMHLQAFDFLQAIIIHLGLRAANDTQLEE